MNISFWLVVIFVLMGLAMLSVDSQKNRKRYIVICTLLLLLTLALRSVTVGADTISYYYIFEEIKYMTWDELFANLSVSFIQNKGDEVADVGYSILMKILSFITMDFHMFTFIINLLFFIPFGKFTYKYAKNLYQVIFAYAFFAMLLIGVAFLGARQLYAIGFDIIAFMYFIERKYTKVFCFIALASTIHLSSIIILLPIMLCFLNGIWLKRGHLLTLGLFPIVYLSPTVIISFLGNAVKSERYAAYAEGEIQGNANTFVCLLFLISLFCYIAIKQSDLNKEDILKYIYPMAPCFTFFGPLINANGTMVRISMYFHMYIILLLPIAIELYFGNNKFHIYKLVYILMIVLTLITGTSNYEFFWDIDPVNTW